MSDTPSWLSSPTAAPAPAPVPSPLEISSPTSPSNAAASSVSDDKDLPSIILFMRLLNMGVAAGSITVAVSYRIVSVMVVPPLGFFFPVPLRAFFIPMRLSPLQQRVPGLFSSFSLLVFHKTTPLKNRSSFV